MSEQFLDHLKPGEDRFLQQEFNEHSSSNLSDVVVQSNGILPVSEELDNEVEGDYFDGVFKYIDQMLMEDDLEEKSWMFHDCLALQPAEANLCQVLNEVNPYQSLDLSSDWIQMYNDPNDDTNHNTVAEEKGGKRSNDSQEDENDEPKKKQLASFTEENERTEDYDDALLCPDRNPNFYGKCIDYKNGGSSQVPSLLNVQQPSKRGRPRASDKTHAIKEVADLRDLLPRCANAIATFDSRTAQELLKKIKNHSSPYGDGTERLAHCFANALEARITGTGASLYTALTAKRASAEDILKSFLTYVTVCPFQRMSNIFANKSIARFTRSAARIHIVDFGILDGFQWPCIIHGLSLRPGGPPRLRITGIDLPQPGFRPAQRVEETGHRLASYAKRFDLPFEYNAIAKKWDTITLEDLKIDNDETLVLNCLYKLKNVNDESVGDNSPRDLVMKLFKNINPDLYVHGILNAGYNAPFFKTRFKEAMNHFSCMFDMFEATLPRENQERQMFETEILGRDVMNVIACEGVERVDRPDTYKQWKGENERGGFKQLPLDKKIMREVKFKVKSSYHKDFLVDEDSNWMLQGWKGRVIYALSCLTPSIK